MDAAPFTFALILAATVPCLPREEGSVAAVAARVVLTEAQHRWLSRSLAAGALRRPDDLWSCPEAGAGLVSELQDALCWGLDVSGEGEVLGSTRLAQREVRLR